MLWQLKVLTSIKHYFTFYLLLKYNFDVKQFFKKVLIPLQLSKDCSQVLANLTVGGTVKSALKDYFQINI